jgi:hydroxymethylpyrimidine/phosphomethylpyrimidine kinase
MQKRPYVLSIAGYDPSGGAGVLADVKTFEACKAVGLAVTTAITYQNEDQFHGLHWLSDEQVMQQLEVLLSRYKVQHVKIGLVQSLESLEEITDVLLQNEPSTKIIWDPVFSASAGFVFHPEVDAARVEQLSKKLHMITPNRHEIARLYPAISAEEAAQKLAKHCLVYLKGGHDTSRPGRDLLYKSDKTEAYNPKVLSSYSKHGTGCILSAAITAELAKGTPLRKACLKAKEYVTKVLLSNKTLLGYHKF